MSNVKEKLFFDLSQRNTTRILPFGTHSQVVRGLAKRNDNGGQ